MFGKSKSKTVVKKSVNRTGQVHTVTTSSISRSNGYTETTEVRSVTSGMRSMDVKSYASESRSVRFHQSSSDSLQPNPFKTEFGGANGAYSPVYRSLLSTNNTDARMIGPPSSYKSSYGANRSEPGGYQSPYRQSATTLSPSKPLSTNISKTSTPPVPTTYRTTNAPSSIAKESTTAKPPATSFSSLKSIFSSPVAKTVEVAAINAAKKELTPKKGSKVGPGVVYIFNHEKFDNNKEEPRKGTYKDVKKLQDTFGKRYKMQTKVLNDFKVKEIEAEVSRIERTDYSKNACIVIVILTHGTRHDVVCARDNVYSIDDVILFPMLKNKSLYDKPKIFIVQACKGDNATEQYNYADARTSTLNAPLEIAKLYSTFEGFLSYRGDDGSLFIQIFCENLERDGKTKNVIEIMEDTIKKIVTDYKARQVPTITHNMTKPLVFGSYV